MVIAHVKRLFVVLTPTQNTGLAEAIAKEFPDDSLQVGPGQWFIATGGTTQELSARLGVTEGLNSPAIILAVSAYYGRASMDVWDWLLNRLEAVLRD